MAEININRKDVAWNYVATALQLGVGILLMPFILRLFPPETVAVWTIFTTIVTLSMLFDCGFNLTFTRNVSYVVSGVTELQSTGVKIVESRNAAVDYGLFKGLINSMRWFYARTALLVFVLLATVGTYYIHIILKAYPFDRSEVYIAWTILVVINSYSFYTRYYDSLMQGLGMIKRSKQIQIIGQSAYLGIGIVLVLLNFNLIALVSAQAISIILRRSLSYHSIYTTAFKKTLSSAVVRAKKDFIKPILPNAIKLGLNDFVGALVLQSIGMIGALYFPLKDIAAYNITMTVVRIISALATAYFITFLPRIAMHWTKNDHAAIKQLFIRGCLVIAAIFLGCGLPFILGGQWALEIIRSNTSFLPQSYILIALLIALLNTIVAIVANTIVAKNEIPYLKVGLITSVSMVAVLFIFLKFTNLGILGMVIAPATALLHWQWMSKIIKSLKITGKDIAVEIKYSLNILKKYGRT